MNPRMIIFGVIALAMAGGTALMVKSWMAAQQARFAAPKPKAAKNVILVAKQDLPAGTFIKREHLSWSPWPGNKILKVYVKKGVRSDTEFVGAIVRAGISGGEPITPGRVVKKGNKGFMAAVLSPGFRAVSVRIDPTSGIAGFVFPGDRVDMILAHTVKNESGQGKTKKTQNTKIAETILTNIKVLAVDQVPDDLGRKARIRKTVTLEVTPKQAEVVTVGQALGKVSLALRSLTSDEVAGIIAAVDPDKPTPAMAAERGTSHTSQSEVSRLVDGGSGGPRVAIVRGLNTEQARVSK